MNVYESIQEMIGGTPLVRLGGYGRVRKLKADILAKLEYLNPAGSVKDRVALYMLLDAEKKGLLRPDTTVIEPTSGNTGIGLAAMAASRGNRTISQTSPAARAVTSSAAITNTKTASFDLYQPFGSGCLLFCIRGSFLRSFHISARRW